jgi:hypothetical protein
MHRSVKTTNFGEGYLCHTVRIEGDSSDDADFRALAILLQTVTTSNPDLLRHASACPESGRFFYENGRWVVETRTIVARPAEG